MKEGFTMNALEILDDVTSAGYTAVRLVQMATEQHNIMQEAAREVRERLSTNGIKISLSTPRFDQPGELMVNQEQFFGIRRGMTRIRCVVTIAGKAPRHQFDMYLNENGKETPAEVGLSRMNIAHLKTLPEHAWVPLLRGEEYFLSCEDVSTTPLQELRVICGAPTVREMLFNAIRQACGFQKEDSRLNDVLELRVYEAEQSDLNQFCSLFCSQKLKSTMSWSERAELLEQPMNDLGIKDLDKLAIVIMAAAKAFNMSAEWKSRGIFGGMHACMAILMSDASYALNQPLLKNGEWCSAWSKDLLCKFIEHMGGTIPKTICFRRV